MYRVNGLRTISDLLPSIMRSVRTALWQEPVIRFGPPAALVRETADLVRGKYEAFWCKDRVSTHDEEIANKSVERSSKRNRRQPGKGPHLDCVFPRSVLTVNQNVNSPSVARRGQYVPTEARQPVARVK